MNIEENIKKKTKRGMDIPNLFFSLEHRGSLALYSTPLSLPLKIAFESMNVCKQFFF